MKADNFCPHCGKDKAVEAGTSRQTIIAFGDSVKIFYYCHGCNKISYALFKFKAYFSKDDKWLTN